MKKNELEDNLTLIFEKELSDQRKGEKYTFYIDTERALTDR